MIKDNIKIQIILIILLTILLILPYKSYVNKKVYDPEANYQVLKKINRSNIETVDNIFIVYDQKINIDFYITTRDEPIYIKNLDKLIYLENYGIDIGVKEDGYFSYIIIEKDNKSFYYRYGMLDEVNIKNHLNFINDKTSSVGSLHTEKVEPFIPKLQTPKEFYNNFKEYFFPYYLGDYEVR